MKLAMLSITIILIFSGLSCGGTGKNPIEQLINRVSTAKDDNQRKTALEKVITSGYSLGLLDENGKQLNPNVS
jgi:hypothetical protein